MSYLTDAAAHIIDLIDNHGEIADCKLEQCAVCDEILKMRKSLDDNVTSTERKSNKKITYKFDDEFVKKLETGELKIVER